MLTKKWRTSANSTVRKNIRIAPKRSLKGACRSTGVTKPNTPIGAKRMMKSVSISMTFCALSQKACCVCRIAGSSLPMNTPKRMEKVMTPSSWPLLLAALTTLEGNMRRKMSIRSLLPRPATLASSPSLEALSLALPSIAVAVSASIRPGPIRLTAMSPMTTATVPLKV